MMHKTFWECLEAQLKEDPPTYGHVIKLVAEIKEARQRWGGGQGHVDCSSSLTFFHLWSDVGILEFRFCFVQLILDGVITEMLLSYMFMLEGGQLQTTRAGFEPGFVFCQAETGK